MFGQRRRRWPSMESALEQPPVPAGFAVDDFHYLMRYLLDYLDQRAQGVVITIG